MSELNEVYGNNYHQESHQSRVSHILNIITNNIAHRQFVYQLENCDYLWDNNKLTNSTIQQLCNRVNDLNKELIVKHINIENPIQKKYLPYLIKNTPVEYFYIIDKEMKKCYFIFITPSQMGSY